MYYTLVLTLKLKKMIRTTLLITFALFTIVAKSETNEPCKELVIPANVGDQPIIFELATYNEYVHEVIVKSTRKGIFLDEKHILNEATYKKVRSMKVKAIKSLYPKDFIIMTKKEVKKTDISKGFIMSEEIVPELAKENNSKFEEYTSFILLEIGTENSVVITKPSDEDYANCMINKNQFKYADILAVLTP